MNSKYKDKLVGVYAPGSYDHTSVLGQTHVVEDVEVPNVSKYKYEINYNPKMWVPAKLKNVD